MIVNPNCVPITRTASPPNARISRPEKPRYNASGKNMVAAANKMMRTRAGCCSGSKKNFGTRCQKGVGTSCGERHELSPVWVAGGFASAVTRAGADRVAGGLEADTLVSLRGSSRKTLQVWVATTDRQDAKATKTVGTKTGGTKTEVAC